jgi:hypothetical protein
MLLITIRFLNGVYFLTMGTKKRECLFGEVANYTVGAGLALPKSNHVSGSITIADYCRGEVASPLLKTEPEIRKRGGETPSLYRNPQRTGNDSLDVEIFV